MKYSSTCLRPKFFILLNRTIQNRNRKFTVTPKFQHMEEIIVHLVILSENDRKQSKIRKDVLWDGCLV